MMSAIIIDITVNLSLPVPMYRDVAISPSLHGRGLPIISPLPRKEFPLHLMERVRVR
jgi:hypothetical protein